LAQVKTNAFGIIGGNDLQRSRDPLSCYPRLPLGGRPNSMESIMPSQPSSVPVPGSERSPVQQAQAVGPATRDERLEVTVRLRHRASVRPHVASEMMAPRLPKERQYLSREDLASAHGADPQDIAKVQAFAQAHGPSASISNLLAARRRFLKGQGTHARLVSPSSFKNRPLALMRFLKSEPHVFV
jgi:Pro-kumamolisin, activation domain